ncbi:MAG: AsnC family transcriptional regulator [Candidatus Thorarchaeota archaeon]|nr:AsnC family transcriptional regulator [Candidatus Thorarchaeota archaeon]
MSRKKPLDDLDLQILSALDQLGGKASAELLAQILNRSARTIRYRLSKLKEDGYLGFLYAQTHDRKLGLGDALICLDLAPSVANIGSLFRDIPLFYIYGSTYGQYNGHLAHLTYPINEGDVPEKISRALLEQGLIKAYSIVEIMDIFFTSGQVERLDVHGGWKWDWHEWAAECDKVVEEKTSIDLNFEFHPTRAKFDAKDIAILSYLKVDAAKTLKELGTEIGLSQTQVNKRIKRMVNDGIIKGYKWTTEPQENPLSIYLFFETNGPSDPLLTCLVNLPFPKEMVAESPKSYVFRLILYASDLANFLRGLDKIRGEFKSYSIQIVHHFHSIQMGRFFSYYNVDSNDWDVDIDEYFRIIEDFRV